MQRGKIVGYCYRLMTGKKTCASAAGVIHAQPEVDFNSYQYLWDHHFSNLKPNATSGQSQMPFRKV